MIRLAVPEIGDDDVEAVAAVLRSGQLVQGDQVRRFEACVTAATGAAHAVAVANGTAALHLALLASGVGAGDVVAVTTYSWPATANAIVLCGATPLFVDVDPRTFNMAPDALADALARGPAVRAVLPVDAFGRMADLAAITSIAAAHGASVVEDAACALGASLSDRAAGAWGNAGCFSFHPRKNVTTGEGGAITTHDPALNRRLRTLRNHGLDPDAPTPDFVLAGFNLRLTEFQAALGVTQIGKLPSLLRERRRLAAVYDGLLNATGVSRPAPAPPDQDVVQSYVVLLPPEAARRRADLIAAMRARGVETTIGTYHMPLTTYYRQRFGHAPGDFPATDDVATRALTLPLHARLTDADQRHVVGTLLGLL
jgi:dTDP-4-amino-4,6-dideoxygalactose transaminase